MAAMNIVVSGIPDSAKNILEQAGVEVFGEGGVDLVDVPEGNALVRVRQSVMARADVIVVLSSSMWAKCSPAMGSHASEEKFHEYKSDSGLVDYLNDRFELQLSAGEGEEVGIPSIIANPELEKKVSDLESEVNTLKGTVRDLNGQLADKDGLISNLEMRIQEMQEELDMDLSFSNGEESGSNSEEVARLSSEIDRLSADLSALREENIALKDQLSDAKLSLAEVTEELELSKNSSSSVNDDLQGTIARLKEEKVSIESELSEYRVKYSTASGMLNDKDALIAELKGKSNGEELDSLKEEIAQLKLDLVDWTDRANQAEDAIRDKEAEISSLNETVSSLKGRLSEYDGKLLEGDRRVTVLETELTEKETEVSSLREELESVSVGKDEEISKLNAEKAELQVKLNTAELTESGLKDAISSANEKVNLLNEKISGMEAENAELKKTAEDLKGNSDAVSSEVARLNTELQEAKDALHEKEQELESKESEYASAKSRIQLLERSTERDSDIEELYQQYTELQGKYERLCNGTFGTLAEKAKFGSSVDIHLLNSKTNFENIRFVFSGSTESRKGTYKALFDELSVLNGVNGKETIIVDAVAETCIDYVFEVKNLVAGKIWFENGGNFSRYLSSTSVQNVKVLSPGLGYINDAYFLMLDWGRRLTELNESGYQVIVYLGDISSLVGRVLHEGLADSAESSVYVHGNAFGSRTVVSNMRGIRNKASSDVRYFEYSSKFKKFLDMMKRTNQCAIISEV